MADIEKVAKQFENIWYCEIDHPIYQDTVGEIVKKVIYTMERDHQEQKQKWLKQIADNQLANAPSEENTTHEHTYRSGVYMGLQMAYDIITGVESNE